MSLLSSLATSVSQLFRQGPPQPQSVQQVLAEFGATGAVLVLRNLLLLSSSDLKGDRGKEALKLAYQEVNAQPNAATLLLQAVPQHCTRQPGFLEELAAHLELTPQQQLELGLAAVSSGPVGPFQEQGADLVKRTLSTHAAALADAALPLLVLQRLVAFGQSRRAELLPATLSALQRVASSSQRVLPSGPLSSALLMQGQGPTRGPAVNSFPLPPESLEKMEQELIQANRLAGVMQELGYVCAHDAEQLRALLRQFPDVNELVMAEVIGMMARTYAGLHAHDGLGLHGHPVLGAGGASDADGGHTTWPYAAVVDAVKAATPGPLNWVKVAEAFDHDGFLVPDNQGLALLLAAWRHGAGKGEVFPLHAVIGRLWKNAPGQLSFLKAAVMAPPEVFSFEAAEQKVAPLESSGPPAALSPNFAWYSLELLQVLCLLAEGASLVVPVREILQYPAASCPDLLLVGMASVRTEWNLLQRDVFAVLLPAHLTGAKPNSGEVLQRLWSLNPAVLTELLVEFYAQDVTQLPRIHAILLALKSPPGALPATAPGGSPPTPLTSALAATPLPFSLELALLAAGKGSLKLETWLSEYAEQDSLSLIPAALRFVLEKTMDGAPGPAPGGGPLGTDGKVVLTQEAARAFLAVLQASASGLPGDLLRELAKVQAQLAKAFPTLASAITPVAAPGSFASDVEEEANGYFQAIYNSQKPIEDILARMRAYKSSSNTREQEVFACMIHNLLDEYRFFPRYPPHELSITAALFGSLVSRGLVSSITLGMALRYVADALRKPPGSKMFSFGREALRQFADMVRPWPQFAAAVLSIPHLREADPELYARVEAAVQGQPGAVAVPGSSGNGAVLPDGSHAADTAGQQSGGSSRFLALQPAGGSEAPGAGGGADDASGKPDAGTGAGEAAARLATPAAAASAGAGAGGAADDRTMSLGLSLDEGAEGSMLATAVATASLSAPKEAPSLTALVNTESLESAAEKFRVAEKIKEPPESVADKVHFIMNNVMASTVDTKAVEIKERTWPQYGPWFANYMVVKRAAQEANYHGLYITLLDKMGERELYRLMVKTTMYYVKTLLYSERILKESNDRALLKNLGVWLGLLTYARNRPVLSRDLELKSIIAEAYQRGRLIAVLPFVQKLLECCRDSKVFKPHNPMVAGILSVLAELHAMKGLKINNAFSIELVFKAFGLSPGDVKPSEVLRALPRERLQNPDWGVDALPQEPTPSPPSAAAAAAQAQAVAAAQEGKAGASAPSPAAQQQAAAQRQSHVSQGTPDGKAPGPDGTHTVAAAAAAGGHLPPMSPGGGGGMPGAAAGAVVPVAMQAAPDPAMFATLAQHIVINPSLGPIADRLQLKRHVPAAVDRAIGEIITPVVERSVTIACYTAFEMVMKDFALEPDEGRMRKAAHLMVSSLAGSLSLVTCKDPLRISLGNQLRAALTGQLDAGTLEQVVSVVVGDNLDLGCTLIERAATEKAMRDIDKSLASAYEERQRTRAAGKNFAEVALQHPNNSNNRFPNSLPDSLRPRPGSIQPHQLRVYEDFARIPRTAAATQQAPGVPPGAPGAAAGAAGVPPAGAPVAGGVPPRPFLPGAGDAAGADGKPGAGPTDAAAAVLLEKYLLWQGAVDAAIQAGAKDGSGDQSDLQALLAELSELVGVNAAASPEDSAAFLARRLFKAACEGAAAGNKLALSFHIACLEVMASVAPRRVTGELVLALLAPPTTPGGGLDEERRLNKDVAEALLRQRLLFLPELDTLLAKALAQPGRSAAVTDLALHILRISMLRDGSVAYADLGLAMDILGRLAAGNTAVMSMLDQARRGISMAPVVVARPPGEIPALVRDKAGDPAGLREQAIQLFEEWVRLTNGFAFSGLAAAMAMASGPNANPAALDEVSKLQLAFLGNLRAAGLLKGDDTTDRFLRMLMELSVAHCLVNAEPPAAAAANAAAGAPPASPRPEVLAYLAPDALVGLAMALYTTGGGAGAAGAANGGAGAASAATGAGAGEALLGRFLAMLVAVIKRDADELGPKFNARPFLRIWAGLMSELARLGEPQQQASAATTAAAAGPGQTPPVTPLPPMVVSLEGAAAALRGLRLCGTHLHQLQPLSVPGFAFAWLELIAHRAFMPRMLSSPPASSSGSSGGGNAATGGGAAAVAAAPTALSTALAASGITGQQTGCWTLYEALLAGLLRFLEPFLRSADLSDAIKQLYKGTLRLLLVLLHDFPEFLCEHHFGLCDAIPPTAVQMRNLVLSAFPRNMRLPDPFTPNLKVDLLPEIQQAPRVVPEPEALVPEPLRNQVNSYLGISAGSGTNSSSAPPPRQPANLPAELAKRVTLLPGEAKAAGCAYNVPLLNALLLYIGSQARTVTSAAHNHAQDLYARLAGELDHEGRYLLLNGLANQLRYPNAHTYYFSCTLLTMFMEAKTDMLKEQVTRALLERLIVNRPHPWGLLITFIELIKNRRYNFWSHGFTKCAPEIENLFTSVSRSCLGNRPEDEAAAAAAQQQQQGARETAVRG